MVGEGTVQTSLHGDSGRVSFKFENTMGPEIQIFLACMGRNVCTMLMVWVHTVDGGVEVK